MQKNPYLLKTALCAAAVAALCCTNATVSAFTVTTTNGNGADVEIDGWHDTATDVGINTDQMNARQNDTRNEVTALRFDLTGYTLADYSDYTLNLVNERANTAVTLQYYGVVSGAVGEDNNGSTPGYTDDTWDETAVTFSTMPGLHWASTSSADETTNADAVFLGSALMNATAEGSMVSFSSPALTAFVKNHPGNQITILILQSYGSSSQARFASKEATMLASGGSGVAGDYAPSLSFGNPITSVTWTGAEDNDWNNANNWLVAMVPTDGVNALIPSTAAFTVNYNTPAPSFGNLEMQGSSTLNVNSTGFTNAFIFENSSSALVNVNNGGDVTVSGDTALYTGAKLTLAAGGSLNVAGNLLVGSGSTGGTGGGTSSSYGSLTNNGGTLTAGQTLLNYPNGSLGSGHPARLTINGGVNNLGAVTIKRQPSSSDDMGLIVNNGLVTTASITVQANSYCSMFQAGGIITNTGAMTIRMDSTTARPARFVQSGGLFVTTDPNVVSMYPNGSSASVQTYYDVNAGTNMVGGFQLGVASTAGTARVRNFANIYIGSMGITWDGVASADFQLNSGSILGATADWDSTAPLDLQGGTIQAADPNGNPFNITVDGPLTGGAFTKSGAGILTLNAPNTYSGNTTISAGSLVLGVSGTIVSPVIDVMQGATFDVSANPGFTLGSGQTLAGAGNVTGTVTSLNGSTLVPGDSIGTLTFANDLSQLGGVNNVFELSSGSNDLVEVAGNLALFGVNNVTVVVSGGNLAAGTYNLFHYGGSLSGDTNNFSLTGVSGYLTNRTDVQMIALVTTGLRGSANQVWVGNATENDWDILNHTNWLANGVLDSFVNLDTVRFDDTGTANPDVNVADNLLVSSMTVDATANYSFSGPGSIGGGALIKTNTGTLSLLTTNDYAGPTLLQAGALEINTVADSGFDSSLGAGGADATNLVLGGGTTLRYTGSSASMNRGATLDGGSATIEVTDPNSTLTVSGEITGSGLAKSGPGALILSGANTYTNSTILNAGTLQINSTIAALPSPVVFNGGTLSLNVSSQQTYSNPLNVTNAGTLISAGGNNNIMQGAWSGAGTLNVSVASGGYFTINNDMTTNFTGTILLTDTSGGTFRFNGGGNSTGVQQSTGSQTATFNLGNGSVTLLNRNGGGDAYGTYYLGALAGGSSTFIKGAANGSSPTTYQIGDKNLSTTYAGTIANGDSLGPVAITKVGTGTLTLAGLNTFSGNTVISSGVLALTNNPDTFADGSIDNSATIEIGGGAALDVSGRSYPSLALGYSQTLQGGGTLLGGLDASGTVAPGGGIGGDTGTLTVTNTVNLYGTTWMKLNRSNSPNSDRLVSMLAPINYGGTLIVTNIGAKLQVGDTFTLFSASALNAGVFGSVILPTYYTWDTSNLGVNGTIQVTAAQPSPAIGSVDYSTLANGYITLNAMNGTPNGPVSVLTSTNLATPVSSWTQAVSGFFDASGNFSTSVTADPVASQSFYLLQAN